MWYNYCMEARMLNCTLEEMPISGVLWSIIVVGFVFAAGAIALIINWANRKK